MKIAFMILVGLVNRSWGGPIQVDDSRPLLTRVDSGGQ